MLEHQTSSFYWLSVMVQPLYLAVPPMVTYHHCKRGAGSNSLTLGLPFGKPIFKLLFWGIIFAQEVQNMD